jgi:hypothetical protein
MFKNYFGRLVPFRAVMLLAVVSVIVLSKPQPKADAWVGGVGRIAYCLWQYEACLNNCQQSCPYSTAQACSHQQSHCTFVECPAASRTCMGF